MLHTELRHFFSKASTDMRNSLIISVLLFSLLMQLVKHLFVYDSNLQTWIRELRFNESYALTSTFCKRQTNNAKLRYPYVHLYNKPTLMIFASVCISPSQTLAGWNRLLSVCGDQISQLLEQLWPKLFTIIFL